MEKRAEDMMDTSLYCILLDSAMHSKAQGMSRDAAYTYAGQEISKYITTNAAYLGLLSESSKDDLPELVGYAGGVLKRVLDTCYEDSQTQSMQEMYNGKRAQYRGKMGTIIGTMNNGTHDIKMDDDTYEVGIPHDACSMM